MSDTDENDIQCFKRMPIDNKWCEKKSNSEILRKRYKPFEKNSEKEKQCRHFQKTCRCSNINKCKVFVVSMLMTAAFSIFEFVLILAGIFFWYQEINVEIINAMQISENKNGWLRCQSKLSKMSDYSREIVGKKYAI